MTITFIGAGSWGTALSTIPAAKGHRINVFDIDEPHLRRMEEAMENVDYLPGVKLDGDYNFYTNNEEALKDADVVVFSLPAQIFRIALKSALPFIPEKAIVMNIAKGIEQKTLKRMSEVAEEVFDMDRYVVLSGPSHAEEVGIGMPTTVSVACRNSDNANFIQELFGCDYFRIYTNDDIVGLELGGSLKNVLAVGSGIIHGLGYGDNTRAAMMTRGIAEMTRLGTALGAKAETFAGLSGIGDLIVTCTSQHSRNFRCGDLIGQGMDPEEARKEIGMVVEGMFTAEAAVELAHRSNVEMPISEAIYKAITGHIDVKEAMIQLMGRPYKKEIVG
ncbi:MAG: NAD(P)-dependent glycerol-3-phosphate dehydrogenase [Clostridiales bacterium]|nr:NAD(P)-dependent glycerol-3-phosphate dehydrogenase [Candidatus Crickella caballi]